MKLTDRVPGLDWIDAGLEMLELGLSRVCDMLGTAIGVSIVGVVYSVWYVIVFLAAIAPFVVALVLAGLILRSCF